LQNFEDQSVNFDSQVIILPELCQKPDRSGFEFGIAVPLANGLTFGSFARKILFAFFYLLP